MHPPFKGPYVIVSCGPNYTYLLEDVNGKKLPHAINGRRLKPFHSRNTEQTNKDGTPGTQQIQISGTEDHNQLEGVAELLDDTLPSQNNHTQEPQPSTSGTSCEDRVVTRQDNNQTTGVERIAPQKTQPCKPGEKQGASQLPASTSTNTTVHPNMVQDIVKIVNKNGVKYYRVRLKDRKERVWVFRESVPDSVVHNFHKKKTLAGRARKRQVLTPVNPENNQ